MSCTASLTRQQSLPMADVRLGAAAAAAAGSGAAARTRTSAARRGGRYPEPAVRQCDARRKSMGGIRERGARATSD